MPILHWLTRDEDVKKAQAVLYRLLEPIPEFSQEIRTPEHVNPGREPGGAEGPAAFLCWAGEV
jgi:hypothetical protein